MTKPGMTQQRPMLAVTDLHATMRFYREKLGFSVIGTFGDPPVWCELHRDDVYLMFNAPPSEEVKKDVPRRSRDYQIFYINSNDVVGLREELVGRGAPASEMRVTAYGMKFEVRDPDGIRLWFAQPTDEAPTVNE